MAGRSALNVAAPEEALRFFKRAEGMLDFAEVSDVVELRFQIGLAERSLGRWMDAVASWQESLRLAAKVIDPTLIARTCAAANHNIVFALRTDEARQLTEEALGLLGPAPTSERGQLLGACRSQAPGPVTTRPVWKRSPRNFRSQPCSGTRRCGPTDWR